MLNFVTSEIKAILKGCALITLSHVITDPAAGILQDFVKPKPIVEGLGL